MSDSPATDRTGKPSVTVAIGVIERAGKILICRRSKNGALAGYWEFPGGKCEPGESPVDCLHRELAEELAVTVQILHAFPVIEHEYPAVRVRLHPFLCKHERGDPQPLASDEILWVDASALREYRFPEANAGLIEQIIHIPTSPPSTTTP